MADAQKQLQALTEEYQKLQGGTSPSLPRPSISIHLPLPSPHSVKHILTTRTDLDGLVEARQKLESQQQENKGVQGEFAALDDDANIYKLVGPVLLKQERGEAQRTVSGRLEFIEKEMYVRYELPFA